MSQMYADLTLYFGLCPSMTGWEGNFNDSRDSEYMDHIRSESMRTVMKFVHEPTYRKWGLTFGSYCLVESEEDARLLIRFAEENIDGAEGLIELCDSSHGKIRFFRKIRFDGWAVNRRDELIREMKMSGYKPKPDLFARITSSAAAEDATWEKV